MHHEPGVRGSLNIPREKQIWKVRHATLSANLELNGAKIHAKNQFGNCNVHPSQQFQTPECRKYRVTDDLRWQNSGDTLVPEARRCIYAGNGHVAWAGHITGGRLYNKFVKLCVPVPKNMLLSMF